MGGAPGDHEVAPEHYEACEHPREVAIRLVFARGGLLAMRAHPSPRQQRPPAMVGDDEEAWDRGVVGREKGGMP